MKGLKTQRTAKAAVSLAGLLLLIGCPGTDTTNPTVTIVFPANNVTVDTGNVVIKAVAIDNKSVSKVEFYDGSMKIGEAGTGLSDTFDISWTATAGIHTLKAIAFDGANNTAEHSVQITVNADGGGRVRVRRTILVKYPRMKPGGLQVTSISLMRMFRPEKM